MTEGWRLRSERDCTAVVLYDKLEHCFSEIHHLKFFIISAQGLYPKCAFTGLWRKLNLHSVPFVHIYRVESKKRHSFTGRYAPLIQEDLIYSKRHSYTTTTSAHQMVDWLVHTAHTSCVSVAQMNTVSATGSEQTTGGRQGRVHCWEPTEVVHEIELRHANGWNLERIGMF